ncbi:Asp-hemolysin [Aspergillus awamori]|uniref:Asp-hemolysin n=1 Tax=Aspergillus awamori TaxID=105351 RepID=A0A401L1F5_ASPAW|nr:Asp-hemolysin [Aspergillus awamori]GKZ55825.1 hypothetical protein AnigIFM49718_000991 [Aspergillus niger]
MDQAVSYSTIDIVNGTGESIYTANVVLKEGEFFDGVDPNNEIPPEKLDGIEIKVEYCVYTCRRRNSPTGEAGSIDLVDGDGKRIATVRWDVPWSAPSGNVIFVDVVGSGYSVTADGWVKEGPEFGTAKLQVTKNPVDTA